VAAPELLAAEAPKSPASNSIPYIRRLTVGQGSIARFATVIIVTVAARLVICNGF
jgi:hypothetical protein